MFVCFPSCNGVLRQQINADKLQVKQSASQINCNGVIEGCFCLIFLQLEKQVGASKCVRFQKTPSFFLYFFFF